MGGTLIYYLERNCCQFSILDMFVECGMFLDVCVVMFFEKLMNAQIMVSPIFLGYLWEVFCNLKCLVFIELSTLQISSLKNLHFFPLGLGIITLDTC